jgi:hypothetical protein
LDYLTLGGRIDAVAGSVFVALTVGPLYLGALASVVAVLIARLRDKILRIVRNQ